MKKLIFFDVDGTLMTAKNHLPSSTIEAIAKLKEQGHIPVISTGRPPEMLKPVAETLGIENYIAVNGQYIVANGEPIYTNPLPTTLLEDLIETSYEQGDRTFLLSENRVIGNTFMSEMMDPDFLTYVYTNLYDVPENVLLELFKHMTEKPIKRTSYESEAVLMAFINAPEDKDHFYKQKFPDLHVTRATPLLGEVIMKGSHKATGMRHVMKHFNVKNENTFAFGDSLNDIEMLQEASTSIAMGNGREELKSVADYVTSSVDDEGIYKGLKHLKLI